MAQDICIWERTGPSNTVINGLYTNVGIYNGAAYYNKTVSGSCQISTTYYLFYDSGDNQWKVSESLGGNSWLAYCSALSSTTASCNGNWFVVYQQQSIEDPNVYITDNQCPEWNCPVLSVSGSASPTCNGNYDAVEGRQNAFKKKRN